VIEQLLIGKTRIRGWGILPNKGLLLSLKLYWKQVTLKQSNSKTK